MKTKLETLIENITPLPFTVTEWAGNKTGISNERGHISKSFVFDKHMAGDAKATTAYLVHAANNFPKLLEALENLNELVDWLSKSGNLKSPIEPHPYGLAVVQAKQDARAALTQAREVKG